jgi:hypothetical protein
MVSLTAISHGVAELENICHADDREFMLNSKVEVDFLEIRWPILGSGCGLRIELRQSWSAVN